MVRRHLLVPTISTLLPSVSNTVRVREMSQRGKNWTLEEDEQLCRSWLLISKDPIKGTDQQRADFWKSVKAHAESMLESLSTRPADSIRQRFGYVSQQVSKYAGCVSFVERLNPSGTSAEYKAAKAREMFLKETNSKTFRFESCYDILKNEPKFKTRQESRQLLKRKHPLDDRTNHSEPNNLLPEAALPGPSTSSSATLSPRPIGQKRAKLHHQKEDKWAEILKEMKRKNELLENHTKAVLRMADLRIITTPLDGLDSLSQQLLVKHKEQLLGHVKPKENTTEEETDGIIEETPKQNTIEEETNGIIEETPFSPNVSPSHSFLIGEDF